MVAVSCQLYLSTKRARRAGTTCARGYTMALTIGGKDFERTSATGMMRGSGIFMHDSAADRPAPEFAGTGGEQGSPASAKWPCSS
jgi:hypothetical protein